MIIHNMVMPISGNFAAVCCPSPTGFCGVMVTLYSMQGSKGVIREKLVGVLPHVFSSGEDPETLTM